MNYTRRLWQRSFYVGCVVGAALFVALHVYAPL